MRISTSQIFQSGLNGILDAQTRSFDLQSQISSGKRVNTPGDDPVAASQITSVKNQLAVLEQYQKNADTAENRLLLEDETLSTIKNALDRIGELTIQAGDGALDQTDRAALAVEIGQRLDQLLGLVNTKDTNNQYLFGGYQSGTRPFSPAATGGFDYAGDEGQLFIQIAESLDVAVSDSGKDIFMDIAEPLDFTAAPGVGNTGTAVVANQAITNQETFNGFHPDDAIVTFTVTGGLTNYTVTRVSDGTILSGGTPPEPLSNVPYIEGEPIEFEGIHLSVTGVPANGDVINVTSDPESRLDMLGVVEKLQLGLETIGNSSADNLRLTELVADTLLSLENVQASISETQSEIGARLNSIDDVRNSNADRELISRDILSQIEDLDYAEALSNLTQQNFILEAAQQSFVRVSSLSLFNFI